MEPVLGLLLTAGRGTEHITTAIQALAPKAVVLVTSDTFETPLRRSMGQWKHHYNLEAGHVISFGDAFSDDSSLALSESMAAGFS